MIRTIRCVAASLRSLVTVVLVASGFVALGAQPAHAQPEVVEYYATDALGSIRVVFDGAGQVMARSDYLPFGEAWAPSGNLPPQRFTGQQRDGDEGLGLFQRPQLPDAHGPPQHG